MADDKTRIINQRIHRPPASATWEHQHRWGTGFGDSTPLSVTRIDGGELRIRYGSEHLAVRGELVPVLADMVAAASAWSDKAVDR